jgi:uncharacterized protein
MPTFEFDPAKEARNVRERGLSLARFADIDLDGAISRPDTRRNYGETRIRVFAMLDGRLHVGVMTPRGERIRVISLRRANGREMRWHEKETQSTG